MTTKEIEISDLKKKVFPNAPMRWITCDKYLAILDAIDERSLRKSKKQAEKRRLKYGPDAVCLIRSDTNEFIQ